MYSSRLFICNIFHNNINKGVCVLFFVCVYIHMIIKFGLIYGAYGAVYLYIYIYI
jgi:hypothetical protein